MIYMDSGATFEGVPNGWLGRSLKTGLKNDSVVGGRGQWSLGFF